MSIYQRPNPDELLARVQSEEEKNKRGKLSIFVGYAAGVGKTYAMLEAAHERQVDGVDVVVAYVETHGRSETESLLDGLRVMPRKQFEYRGTFIAEMDVDAVIARRPTLAIVDELAHTNAPGSRHLKRYQDVEELIAAGIDVYTTLNVQHLESLNDVVAQITGIVVHETLPDRVLDQADEINLIDLSPDELLERLREGKVYVPEQAAQAIQQFFRKGNLTALREIALRRAAAQVDEQMRAYMETRAIPGPWAAGDRLLVAVSPGALSQRLIRTGRRLADELKAEWFAIYVETASGARLAQSQRDQIVRLMHLAEELGAQVITLPGQNVPETILQYARSHNITKIVAGKHVHSRWIELWHGSVVNQIIRKSGNIDVYVISGEGETSLAVETESLRPHRPWRRYLLSLGLVAGVTLLGIPISSRYSPTNLVMLYLVAVVIAALNLGRGPAIVTSVLGVFAFDFFFVPPQLTFAVEDTQYLVTFGALLIVGLIISTLTTRVRDQVNLAQRRELEAIELYEFSRDLAGAVGLDEILQTVMAHVSQTFNRDVVVLLPERETLKIHAQNPSLKLSQNELAVAMWAYQHSEPAGHGTETLPATTLRCLPLKTARGIIGVLGIWPSHSNGSMAIEQARLLDSFASQAALAIERANLVEQSRQIQILQATEKLQSALLNSISHDLRTPLVSITGALSSIQEEGVSLDEATRRNLVESAYEDAQRLNHLVGNLLDMTRIQAGAMKIKREPCDVQDVIGSALDRLSERILGRKVEVDIPSDLPLVPMDFVLIVQVLVNLLDNALKYSKPDSPIEVTARVVDHMLEIQVADRGVGIPSQDLARVFDKFYRVQRPDGVTGTGLGLSICKGIVEAHRGTIQASPREGGGAVVTIALPLDEERNGN